MSFRCLKSSIEKGDKQFFLMIFNQHTYTHTSVLLPLLLALEPAH